MEKLFNQSILWMTGLKIYEKGLPSSYFPGNYKIFLGELTFRTPFGDSFL